MIKQMLMLSLALCCVDGLSAAITTPPRPLDMPRRPLDMPRRPLEPNWDEHRDKWRDGTLQNDLVSSSSCFCTDNEKCRHTQLGYIKNLPHYYGYKHKNKRKYLMLKSIAQRSFENKSLELIAFFILQLVYIKKKDTAFLTTHKWDESEHFSLTTEESEKLNRLINACQKKYERMKAEDLEAEIKRLLSAPIEELQALHAELESKSLDKEAGETDTGAGAGAE